MTTQIKSHYDKLMASYAKFKKAEFAYNKAKKEIEALKVTMLDKMADAGTATFKGTKGTLSMVESEIPVVEDWDKFYKYIHKYKAYDLFQRRVSSTAWRDRVETGKKISGVNAMPRFTLRVKAK